MNAQSIRHFAAPAVFAAILLITGASAQAGTPTHGLVAVSGPAHGVLVAAADTVRRARPAFRLKAPRQPRRSVNPGLRRPQLKAPAAHPRDQVPYLKNELVDVVISM